MDRALREANYVTSGCAPRHEPSGEDRKHDDVEREVEWRRDTPDSVEIRADEPARKREALSDERDGGRRRRARERRGDAGEQRDRDHSFSRGGPRILHAADDRTEAECLEEQEGTKRSDQSTTTVVFMPASLWPNSLQ